MPTNNINRFRKEDYPDSPSWWDRAIYSLNLLVDYIFGLSATITTIKSFTISQISASDSTTHPEHNTYSFTNLLGRAPAQVLLAATNANYPIFTAPVWASWHYTNGVILIDAITGLANSTSYQLTITYY